MKLRGVLIAVAFMAAMLALPAAPATAMPRLDPAVAQTQSISHVEKTWYRYHRYYYRPHYYHRYYRPYYHHRYYYHPHYYHRYYRWHRRYW